MTDEISLISQAIKEIGEECSGIITSFNIAPAVLDTAHLPALYPLTGASVDSESTYGETIDHSIRTFRVQVAVLPIGQANAEERETSCRPLLSEVRKVFKSHPALRSLISPDGVPGIQRSRVISDSGIVVLPEWGAKYVGFEIRLQVEYTVERVFSSNE